MEEKNNTCSEEKIEEMFSNMGNYMIERLKKRVEIIKERLENVKKSQKKNKEEIVSKLDELINIMNKLIEKTKLQSKTQGELFDLMEKMEKIDKEIDNLLLE
jgi:hypothetical protein